MLRAEGKWKDLNIYTGGSDLCHRVVLGETHRVEGIISINISKLRADCTIREVLMSIDAAICNNSGR